MPITSLDDVQVQGYAGAMKALILKDSGWEVDVVVHDFKFLREE
ncbi:MAG: hypothetical protein V4436_00685 [Patescibacteria group bacterium]